jgi:hypothetical protein
MTKVASYLDLTILETTEEFFYEWLETLPIANSELTERRKQSLWKKCKNKVSIIWITKKGFKTFKNKYEKTFYKSLDT